MHLHNSDCKVTTFKCGKATHNAPSAKIYNYLTPKGRKHDQSQYLHGNSSFPHIFLLIIYNNVYLCM